MFLGKSVLKICSKYTREHPFQSVISIKMLCNFIEITLSHGCSPVNLLHNFKISFQKNTYVDLLLILPFLMKYSISSHHFFHVRSWKTSYVNTTTLYRSIDWQCSQPLPRRQEYILLFFLRKMSAGDFN